MKKRRKHRVYFFDYLWWLGEKQQARFPGDRMDGASMFFTYYLVLIAVPLMHILIKYAHIVNKFILVVIVIAPFLLWDFWLNKLVYTPERQKAVMNHFASREHSRVTTFALFLLPLLFAFIVLNIYIAHRPHDRTKEPVIPELSPEEIQYLRKNNYIRIDTTRFQLSS
ncbi:MAG: hypothetical protein K2J87_08880 [Muribaculaceae bacterium]|nr:hypothetical protein [Muribaculaceae bacterium]